ncbi:MAG: cytochrome c biogenesis protein CcsA [Pseudomonadota bacterium]
MSNLPLYLIAFLAYGLLAAYFWRAQLAGQADQLSRSQIGHAVIVPLALHGYLLYSDLFTGGMLNLGLGYALSLILWLTMLIYWLARFFYPIASLQTLVLPLAAVAVMLPALFPHSHAVEHKPSAAMDTHIFAAMLAYSLFTIAALHAALMSLVEKRLHRATLPRVLRNLPPLLTMESLLFRVIGIGFVLLTLTLASGFMFSEQLFGKPWEFNHKVLFSLMSWLVFAILLVGHRFQGWRGRTAVRWTLSGFGFLVLAYLGTQFVLEVFLHR